jgi:hypothetical protein
MPIDKMKAYSAAIHAAVVSFIHKRRLRTGTYELIRLSQNYNMRPHLKAAMLTCRPVDDFFSSFRSLDGGVSKMPGYEAIVWGVALSAGVVTIIVASSALIAG